jgi:DNA-binding MarR family transcriptional regulator
VNEAADDVDRIIEQWARERPELQTEAMAVFGRVYRIARLVGDGQERVYAQHGISRGDFDVLATLRRHGAPYQLSPKALSASMMLTTGAMTGRLDKLEQRGLIRRSPDPDDRRGLVITLTDEGRALIDGAVGPGLAAQSDVLDKLPPASRQQLADLLRDLLAAASDDS